MPKFIVCVKQVPIVSKLEFDTESRALRRAGVPSEVSSFDIRALLKAVELRGDDGEVIALTMGPPQASEAIEYCLALGADRGIHLCDAAFAGADTLATARALAAAVRTEAPDVVLFGRQSVDAETAQVGPEIAEILGLPQITAAHTLEIDMEARTATGERETEDGYQTLRVPLPALVTAAEDLAEERFPRKADREAAKDRSCRTVTAAELGIDTRQVGAAGSPTWVGELVEVPDNRKGEVIDAGDIAASVKQLVDRLVDEHGLFGEWKLSRPDVNSGPTSGVMRSAPGQCWVVVEAAADGVRPVSLELIGRARELADACGGSVSAIVLGPLSDESATVLIESGADRVLRSASREVDPSALANTLAAAIDEEKPGIVLFASTTFGRDVAPRVAAQLELGLTSDCIDLQLDDEGRLVQMKPAFGGGIVAPVRSRTVPEMATVRPGVFPAPPRELGRQGAFAELSMRPASAPATTLVEERITSDEAGELERAEIVVGVGKGMGAAENMAALDELVDILGAKLCTTRDVTDEGWLPRQYQVGLTGRSLAPKLYIGIAIRGAFEHMVGLRRAGLLIGINKNPKAPLFKGVVDYGIVGAWQEVIPPLVEELRRRKG